MEVRWTAHPARRRPHDVLLIVGVVLLSAWAVLVGLGSPVLAALAAVLLVAAVLPFLVPTAYRLDDDGVEERRLGRSKRRRWSELRRLEVGPNAALLSPFARRSFLDRHRGLYLLFDGGDRSAVVAILHDRIGPR